MITALRDHHAAIHYEPSRDVVTIQFGSAPEQLHAGAILDDVFVAFDAQALGSPAVVRLATPFWGRGHAWTSAVEEIVTPVVLAAARGLVDDESSRTCVVRIDSREFVGLADRRIAYHRAVCRRAGAEPPLALPPGQPRGRRQHHVSSEKFRANE